MNILGRFKAAWLSFRDPDAYWEGVSIRRISDEITLKDGMALLRADPEIGYRVDVLPYQDQAAIRNYLHL